MRRTALLSGACLLGLTACGGSDQTSDAAPPTLPSTSSSTPAHSSEASSTSTNESNLNDRGNFVKTVGEEAGVTDRDGNQMITFAVDSITVNPACDSGFAEPSKNGQFIAIDIRASTSSDMPSDWSFYFAARDFSVVGSDGITRRNLEGSASFCIDPARTLGEEILSPASQYAGTIVIDSPAATGSLIYHPAPLGGSTGWEWPF